MMTYAGKVDAGGIHLLNHSICVIPRDIEVPVGPHVRMGVDDWCRLREGPKFVDHSVTPDMSASRLPLAIAIFSDADTLAEATWNAAPLIVQ
jgi:hypothetical protein